MKEKLSALFVLFAAMLQGTAQTFLPDGAHPILTISPPEQKQSTAPS
ncbi:hypothetical protein [Bacillus aerolatus]|nr:hypothetical protein [Bacillus aerolatus]